MLIVIEQNSMNMVRHYDFVYHFKPFETGFEFANAPLHHLSCIIQEQLAISNLLEKFTPAFGHYRYKIAPYGGIIISSQP